MNLRDLEYLTALADHRHFGRAAAACYVSQPTLSTQIRKLETELGVDLVERGSRSVLLTPVGADVVARARSILDQAGQIHEVARAARDPRSGRLRLGVFPTIGPYLLPHVVPLLARRLPELEVLLVEEKSERLLDALRSGSLDAAVLALPIEGDALEVRPMFREEFVLATPGDSELAGEQALDASDLAGSELLLLDEGHCLRSQALELCDRVGAGERVGFRATSLETLRHMVAAGVGSTLLPRLSVTPPTSPTQGVALREFAAPAPHRDVALVWRRSSPLGAVLPEVADTMVEGLGALVDPLTTT